MSRLHRSDGVIDSEAVSEGYTPQSVARARVAGIVDGAKLYRRTAKQTSTGQGLTEAVAHTGWNAAGRGLMAGVCIDH
jgi:hypothetical protein